MRSIWKKYKPEGKIKNNLFLPRQVALRVVAQGAHQSLLLLAADRDDKIVKDYRWCHRRRNLFQTLIGFAKTETKTNVRMKLKIELLERFRVLNNEQNKILCKLLLWEKGRKNWSSLAHKKVLNFSTFMRTKKLRDMYTPLVLLATQFYIWFLFKIERSFSYLHLLRIFIFVNLDGICRSTRGWGT